MGDVILAILETLAEQKEVPPEEMTPPLEETIDTDALEGVVRSDSVRVTFRYDGYEVTVTGEDEIEVTPLEVL